MDDDTVQLVEEWCAYLFGVGGNSVQGNINITIHARTRGIIKGDNIGVIIVLKELAINSENLLVVAENIVEFAYGLAVLSCGALDPLLHLAGVDGRHGDVVSVEGDHIGLKFIV